MKGEDSQLYLLEHSKAKVALYGYYLAIYLEILSRYEGCTKIRIFDLMCGEGIYLDGGRGSPIIALDAIKAHCAANPSITKPIEIWFNDNAESRIEQGLMKVERVRDYANSLGLGSRVHVKYFTEDYLAIHERALQQLDREPRTKSLFYVDPYGYKVVTPQHIGRLLSGEKTEALLFVPAVFMYRFSGAVSEGREFSGLEPLTNLLNELFDGNPPKFESSEDFVRGLRTRFQDYLRPHGAYVDLFLIERSEGQLFCLLFFTTNKTGYQKMVDAKWKMDHREGTGFMLPDPQVSMMEVFRFGDFVDQLLSFTSLPRTNEEINDFGYENGYTSAHTKKAMDEIANRNIPIEVVPLDSGKVRKNSWYIGNKERLVRIKVSRPAS